MKKKDFDEAREIINRLSDDATVDEYSEAVNDLYAIIHVNYIADTHTEELFIDLLRTLPAGMMTEYIDKYISSHDLIPVQKERLLRLKEKLNGGNKDE